LRHSDAMNNAIQSLVLAAAGNGGPANPNSRYYGATVESLVLPSGVMVQYLKRRIIPSASIYTSLQNYTVIDGDRTDNLAAKYLGDPTLYWLICDANTSLDPDALTSQPGSTIQIPLGAGIPAGARNG
jgi:hypothetical protein